jgi:hypothetical protein
MLAVEGSSGGPNGNTEETDHWVNTIHGQNYRNSSDIFNPIFLASSDDTSSDFGHYCAEVIMLGLCPLGVSRGRPGRPFI